MAGLIKYVRKVLGFPGGKPWQTLHGALHDAKFYRVPAPGSQEPTENTILHHQKTEPLAHQYLVERQTKNAITNDPDPKTAQQLYPDLPKSRGLIANQPAVAATKPKVVDPDGTYWKTQKEKKGFDIRNLAAYKTRDAMQHKMKTVYSEELPPEELEKAFKQ
eukprot:TRINITY_DN7656_c0_g1_i1.p1 TRINITY_DN7656_c0_g1~~TRINITY_DN7656_c0_g1_i1.p1  ORF type:complete len:162 (-),score=41.49 TRINITY_DN7656_c0_g1_i1:191-676(-)